MSLTLDYSPKAQAQRREDLRQVHRHSLGGVDNVHIREELSRSRMWHALAWLAGPDPGAEAIEKYIIGPDPWGPCAFSPAVSMQLLVRFAEVMSAGLRAHLENYATAYLEHETRARFAGYNDNFPAMSAVCLALAGRYFDQPQWSRGAETVLQSAVELLRRRDYMSEYLSTTYSPITLGMFAEIVEYTNDSTVQEMATELESRLWGELLSHWHIPSCSLAGPHSRSYELDSVAHVTMLHYVMYSCFGRELVPLNPRDYLYPPPPELVIHHEGDIDFVRAGALWDVSPTYHVPAEVVGLLLEPNLPRTEVGTAEGGQFRDIVAEEAGFDPPWHGLPYAPGVGRLVTYLSEHFTLGTASRDWLNGDQQDIFTLKVSTRHKQPWPQPPRILFTRYVSGHKIPGEDNYYPDLKKNSTMDLLHEEGRRHCLQSDNLAVVAYWPKRRLDKAPTNKLALNLLLPCHFSRPDEVWLGETKVGDKTVELAEPQALFVREGATFVAVLPLTVDDLGRKCAVRAEQRGVYLVVEYVNYEGEERIFTQPELLPIRNGFAAIVEEAQGRDFAAWRRQLSGLQTREEWSPNTEVRSVEFTYGETQLKLQFSPATEFVQYATVNREMVE